MHDPSDLCQGDHCYSCGVDESAAGAHVVCGECGHVYRTARSIRRAYRRTRLEGDRPTQLRSDEWHVGWVALIWHLLTVRASDLYYCQECGHDL
jgi:predicted RNA-binding Zn-ribbon protein involved in translation (DUF1610 family)